MRDNTITYKIENFINLSIEKYGSDSWDYSLLPEMLNSNTYYKFICKTCGNIIEETPTQHLRRKRRSKEYPGCQFCHLTQYNEERRKRNEENFIQMAENLYGKGTYLYDNLQYKTQRDPVIITKPDGEKFSVRAESFLRGKTDDRKRSLLEKHVFNWLTNNRIEFSEQEKLGEICTSVEFVRVDFYFKLNNITYIIETNGKQHYHLKSMLYLMNKSRYNNGTDRYRAQIQRDDDLRAYCLNKGISLIEIPYTYNTYPKIDKILKSIILDGKTAEEIIILPAIEKL